MCGRITGFEGHCVIHDQAPCPERDWSHTYMATVIAPIVMNELGRSLEDLDLELMAECYLENKKGETFDQIAKRAVEKIRFT